MAPHIFPQPALPIDDPPAAAGTKLLWLCLIFMVCGQVQAIAKTSPSYDPSLRPRQPLVRARLRAHLVLHTRQGGEVNPPPSINNLLVQEVDIHQAQGF